jgi:sensor histidine kinase YesM
VENAVKHGLGKQRGVGRIEIEARREGDRVVLRVRDNGPGMDGGAPAREGVGLRNTRERLAQLYGGEGGLVLRPAEGGGVEAEVSLPWRPAAPASGAAPPATAGAAG